VTAFPWPVHPAAELFPLLGDGELRELADDIRAHGMHEPVWLWDDPDRGTVLLDGRNRSRACQLADVEVRTRRYNGDDPIAFSISANEKRRHLTAGQRSFLALQIEALYAAEAKQTQGRRTDLLPQDFVADLPQSKPEERKSRERAAKVVKASGRGVSQAKRVEREAPDLAEKVRAGQMAIDRAERIIRDREAEQRRIERARAEAAAQPAPTIVDIRAGDFREVLADLHDIDAVITDPPYPHEFIPLLEDLAIWADKVLGPDGVLAVLMGQTYLPDVYRLLDGHRPYRWTACYLTDGPGYVSHQRRVQSNWKPLIIYGGGPRFADVIRSEGQDADAKSNHRWGQDYAAFHTIIERLTERGQTVADPFMGSGTTLLAAHALGRHAIGADVDAAAVSTARERLS
jgi:16S rRNA G966 N2-methylase RsmD